MMGRQVPSKPITQIKGPSLESFAPKINSKSSYTIIYMISLTKFEENKEIISLLINVIKFWESLLK